jgi:hypothetical protein
MLGSIGVKKALAGPAMARTLLRAVAGPAVSSAVSAATAPFCPAAPSVTSAPARSRGSRPYFERCVKTAIADMRKRLTSSNQPRLQLAAFMRQKPTIEQRLEALEQYTTKSILEHSPEDAMRLYEVNTELVPPVLKKSLNKELEGTGGYVMVRSHMVEMVDFLRSHGDDINLPFPPELTTGYARGAKNLALIYGHRGTGKSVSLAYAAEWAKHAGWLVVGTSINTWANDHLGLIQPSLSRPHTFTQPLFCRQWLQDYAIENAETLKSIELQGDYSAWPWHTAPNPMYDSPKVEAEVRTALPFPSEDALPRLIEAPATLYDLMRLGAWRVDLATEALYAAFWELQHTTAVPVLFAIDNVNAMDAVTDFVHPQRVTKLVARRLAGVDALANVIDCPPRRGAVLVAATTHQSPSNNVVEMADRAGTQFHVKRYTPLELQVMIEHYVVSRLTRAEPNLTLLRRAEVTTGGVPADVHDYFKFM